MQTSNELEAKLEQEHLNIKQQISYLQSTIKKIKQNMKDTTDKSLLNISNPQDLITGTTNTLNSNSSFNKEIKELTNNVDNNNESQSLNIKNEELGLKFSFNTRMFENKPPEISEEVNEETNEENSKKQYYPKRTSKKEYNFNDNDDVLDNINEGTFGHDDDGKFIKVQKEEKNYTVSNTNESNLSLRKNTNQNNDNNDSLPKRNFYQNNLNKIRKGKEMIKDMVKIRDEIHNNKYNSNITNFKKLNNNNIYSNNTNNNLNNAINQFPESSKNNSKLTAKNLYSLSDSGEIDSLFNKHNQNANTLKNNFPTNSNFNINNNADNRNANTLNNNNTNYLNNFNNYMNQNKFINYNSTNNSNVNNSINNSNNNFMLNNDDFFNDQEMHLDDLAKEQKITNRPKSGRFTAYMNKKINDDLSESGSENSLDERIKKLQKQTFAIEAKVQKNEQVTERKTNYNKKNVIKAKNKSNNRNNKSNRTNSSKKKYETHSFMKDRPLSGGKAKALQSKTLKQIANNISNFTGEMSDSLNSNNKRKGKGSSNHLVNYNYSIRSNNNNINHNSEYINEQYYIREIRNYQAEIRELKTTIAKLRNENDRLKNNLQKEKKQNEKFKTLTEEIIKHYEKSKKCK